MVRSKPTAQRKPINVQRKPTKRVRKSQNIGEFGLQDLKNIAHDIKERVSPTIPVARPQKTQYQSPRSPSRRSSPVTELTPRNAPVQPQQSNVRKTSQIPEPTVRKTTEIPTPTPQKKSIGQRISEALHKKPQGTPAPAAQPTATPKPRTSTVEERRAAKQAEREAKRAAWRSSLKNANNKNRVTEPSEQKIPEDKKSEIISRLKKNLKAAGESVEKGASEVAEDITGRKAEPAGTEEEVDAEDGETEEPIKLYGSGDKYRTDGDGILYRKGTHGWVSTGRPSKYGKPKEVSEDVVEDDSADVDSIAEPSSRSSRSRGRTPKPALSSGILGGSGDGGGEYDEDAEKERMKQFEKSGSSLNVNSGYISAGSYKGSGYNERAEQERVAKIGRAGSVYKAGLNYLTAGSGRVKNPNAPDNAHLGEINDANSFSSGQYKFSYGTAKPKQPVDVGQQIEAELARVAQITARQAELNQLQELQKLQAKMQPPTGMPQPEVKQPPKDTMQFLFGISTKPAETKATPQKMGTISSVTAAMFGTKQKSSSPKKPDNRSATDKLFGGSIPKQKTSQDTKSITDGSAVTNFFGLTKMKAETPKKTEVGAFGRNTRKPKAKAYPKQVVDIKTYTPKNYMPESKGGILGIYEKNAQLKKVGDAPKIRPTATETIFGKR